jgi:hypothetical protein
MKILFLSVLFAVSCIIAHSQNYSTLCIPASQDASIYQAFPNTNDGFGSSNQSARWTWGAQGLNGFWTSKSLHQFDLSNIPTNAIILSATLTLKPCSNCGASNYLTTHNDLSLANGNAAILEQLGSPWTENGVTWNNAPSVLTGSVFIPSLGNGSTSNVVINVSSMVNNMHTTGVNNGFLISLVNNNDYYHALRYASRENSDTTLRPELCVNFSMPTTTSSCNVLFDEFNDPNAWQHPLLSGTCSSDYSDLSISGGTFNFVNANDGHFNYMSRSGLAISNDHCKAEIDFSPNSFGSNLDVGVTLLSLTTGTQALVINENSNCIVNPCNYNGFSCPASPQKSIYVEFLSNTSSGISWEYRLKQNYGGYLTTAASIIVPNNIVGLTHYISLERMDLNNGVLSVYSDATRTTHIPGSPVTFTIPSSMINLNSVILGVNEAGWFSRELSGTLDNLCITNLPPCTSTCNAQDVVGCPSCSIPLVGSPAGGTFSVPNPYTGPSTTYTYTYTDPATGCTATSAPATITVSNNIPVTGFHLVSATGSTATFAWDAIPCIAWYTIRYRPLGSSGSWTSSTTGTIPKTITGLTAGTDYEIEIRANCSATSPGAFLTATTFTTGAPCCVPTGLTVGTVTGHTASVSWNSCLDAAWYNIRYRELPSGSWVGPFSATSPSYNITGLNLSTPYEFQVLTKCSATDISSWSIPQNFTTLAFRPSNDVNETNENFEDAIRVYPNPVGDMLHIQVTNSTSASTTIKVFDLSGRKIREVRANTQIGTNDLEIDMSNVSKGIYTIQIFEDEKLTHVSKITK